MTDVATTTLRPFLPGVGGGRAHAERIERKVHELAAEFGGLDALTAVDRALVMQAAALMHRRTSHGTDDAVRRANAIARLLSAVRRHRPRRKVF